MMFVPVCLGKTVELSAPELLFEASFAVESGGQNQFYDVAPDGRIIFTRMTADVDRIRVALGWARELETAAAQ